MFSRWLLISSVGLCCLLYTDCVAGGVDAQVDTLFAIPHNPFFAQTRNVSVPQGMRVTFEVDAIVGDVVSQALIQSVAAQADLLRAQYMKAYGDAYRKLHEGGTGTYAYYDGEVYYYSTLDRMADAHRRNLADIAEAQARDTEAAIRKFTNWYLNGVFQETDVSNRSNNYADPTYTKVFVSSGKVEASVLDANFSAIRVQTWLVHVTSPVAVREIETVVPFGLAQNSPNPFNPTTTIRFTTPASGVVNVAIYDVNGRLVRTLVDGPVAAGYHEVVWSGTGGTRRAASWRAASISRASRLGTPGSSHGWS